MRLEREFFQLPIRFDVDRMVEEVSALRDEDWVAHPREKHNAAVILVSVNGDDNHAFANAGTMRETPHLERCPYLRQVLASFGVPISRSRLMRLDARSELKEHLDYFFHWFRRTRIHIPIVTQPSVRFHCGERSVHMGAGEGWIFDNFRPHRVVNPADVSRIHLVADTRGSESFWKMVRSAETTEARMIHWDRERKYKLELEEYQFEVLSPDEMRALFSDAIADLRATDSSAEHVAAVITHCERTCAEWDEAFRRHGHTEAGEPAYTEILVRAWETFVRDLRARLPPLGRGNAALQVIRFLFAPANGFVPGGPVSAWTDPEGQYTWAQQR